MCSAVAALRRDRALMVLANHVARAPFRGDAAVTHEDDALAEPLDRGEIVRDEHDRRAGLLELLDALHALRLERRVADGEHLVEQEDLRIEMRRDGEAEPHVHARRVALHRRVDELTHARELDDAVELRVDLAPAHPHDRAAEIDVLAPGELGVEPEPTSMSAESRPLIRISPSVGTVMLAISLRIVDFPAPLCPMMPSASPRFT